jgi:hypothetical protein
MAYNYQNFLRPISSEDRNIQVIDSTGKIKYTINAFHIVNTVVSNNIVKINLKSNKVISIDFNTNNEAREALSFLQTQIDTLVNKVPYNIDKQIENFVLDQSFQGSQGIFEIEPEGGTLSIFGTTSQYGDILPGFDNTYNLGSPALQWKSLYVGTSSIYIGGVTLSSHDDSIVMNSLNLGTVENPVILRNDEGTIIYGDIPVTKYFATSSTPLQLPDIDGIVVLNTPRNLSYRPMQKIVVYNVAYEGYMVSDYVDDDSVFFTGLVDSYVSGTESGQLEVIVDYSTGYGLTNSENIVPTYSFWNIDISSSNWGSAVGMTASFTELTVTGPINIQQVIEVLTTATSSPGLSPSTFNLNFDDGSIFYIEPEGDNFTANYLNVSTTDDRIISTTIIISQTASAYIPDVVAINGDIIPISWANGLLPSGNANQTDIVGFSFMRIGATWSKVFGQLSTFANI